jgi:tetraacyldisaccharide 4'-kinase
MTARQSRIVRHSSRWLEEVPVGPARWLAAPLWLPWRLLVGLRNAAFDHHLLRTVRLPLAVISIGNLTAGGTGKTPAALAVVAALRARGWHPTILSRGYRGVDGVNEEAHLAGDIPVICNPDRHAAGLLAQSKGADCVVLDDGFQHRRLYRDLDIVILDATRPWGRDDGRDGAVLPLGYLRESRAALKRAGLLWLTRTDLVPDDRLRALKAELAGLAPLVEERTARVTFLPLGDAHPALTPVAEASTDWRGRRVLLVSGIGHPLGFERLAEAHGVEVVASHRFPDHHHFTAADAATLAKAAIEAEVTVVTTSKDAVKLRAFAAAFTTGAWVMQVTSQLVDETPLRQALDHLRMRS